MLRGERDPTCQQADWPSAIHMRGPTRRNDDLLSSSRLRLQYAPGMDLLPNAPDGYSLAAGPPTDIRELTALVGAVQLKYEGVMSTSDSFWTAVLADRQMEPLLDLIQMRSTETGELVGFGRYENQTPHVESMTRGFVHPDHEDLGIGTVIVEWGLVRSRAMVDDAPTGVQVTNLCFAASSNDAARELFEESGYATSRYFLEMQRELDGLFRLSRYLTA